MTVIKPNEPAAFGSDVKSHDTDVPPPYASPPSSTPSTGSPGPSSRRHTQTQMPRPNIPPTNHLTIKRDNNSIREAVVIDPGLQLPSSLFEPGSVADADADWKPRVDGKPGDGEGGGGGVEGRRKNLLVESKNGSVNVDVWLVSDSSADASSDDVAPPPPPRRSELDISSKNGSVTVRLNTTAPHPYALTASSRNGSVTLALPSSFVGPVILSSADGSITFSPAVLARTVTFSDVDGRKSCFVGDVRAFQGRETWTGSTVDASTRNGRVKLSFVDEEPAPASGEKGFWGKLFRS